MNKNERALMNSTIRPTILQIAGTLQHSTQVVSEILAAVQKTKRGKPKQKRGRPPDRCEVPEDLRQLGFRFRKAARDTTIVSLIKPFGLIVRDLGKPELSRDKLDGLMLARKPIEDWLNLFLAG